MEFLKLFKDTAFYNQKFALEEFKLLESNNKETIKEKRKAIYDRKMELNSFSYSYILKEYLQFVFNNSIQNKLIRF